MKTKILNALKTEYAKTLGVGDKALDGVASFLAGTITDENDIDTRIKGEDVKNLLKVFQSEADKLRTEKSAAEKALEDYRKAHPEQTPPPAPKPEEDSEVMKLLKQLQADNKELKEKYAESEKKARNASLIAQVRESLKGSNRDNEALLNIILANPVIGDEDTADTLLQKFQGEYDTQHKALYGDGFVPPAGERFKPQGYKKGMFASVKKALQENGSLPPEKEQ